ncbi:MAG: MarR family transcriptional regulator [Neptunomonas phycophila]|uniref:MarR family transcriptional regulator n=1 Tax=Neptunomonas phycophila TaxID=1572645 RepID=UPI003B8B6BE9
MVSDEIIRVLMVNDLDSIKSLMLTKNDLEILSWIDGEGETPASALAMRNGVTVVNASTKLKKLFDQGYLNRTLRSSKSGGDEYLYHSKNYQR